MPVCARIFGESEDAVEMAEVGGVVGRVRPIVQGIHVLAASASSLLPLASLLCHFSGVA